MGLVIIMATSSNVKPGGIELIAVDTSGHDDSWSAIEGDRSTAMLFFFDKFYF